MAGSGRQARTLVALLAGVLLAAGALSVWLVLPAQAQEDERTEFLGPSDFEKSETSLEPEGLEPVPENFRIDEDPDGNPYVAGELSVVYESRATTQAVEEVSRETDAQVVASLPDIESQTLSFLEVKDESSETAREDELERIKDELESDPAVKAVSYSYIGKPLATPNDRLFGIQWGLRKISAPQAWDTARGNRALISIIDSGIDLNHPDVAGKMVAAYDYLRDDPSPNDETGHGTHVAGIAAAFTNNGAGVAGTSPNSPIVVQKVCDDAIGCPFPQTNAAIIDAANYNNPTYGRVKVINLSLGGFGRDAQQEAAINYALSKGVVVVAAAGNDNTNRAHFPSGFQGVISVSSTNINNGKSDFSNFGKVEIAAPGGTTGGGCQNNDDIASTYPRYIVGSGYAYLCGTSMASPFVTGVAALIASQGRSAAEIRQRLLATATDLGPAGRDAVFGAGLVNARAAVAVSTNTPPRILTWFPQRSTFDNTPVIGAQIKDDQHRLYRKNLKLYVDGRLVSRYAVRTGSTTRLEYQSPYMRNGWHLVKVVATDPNGRSAIKTWRFLVR